MSEIDELDRSSTIDVLSYDLALDLTDGPDHFWSRARIRFRCLRPGAASYADIRASRVHRATLNGMDLDQALDSDQNRIELLDLAEENLLVVEARFPYVTEGTGMHRHVAADGSVSVFSSTLPDGAPRMYCCFDDVGLRAPFTVSAMVPAGWSCAANGRRRSTRRVGRTMVRDFATTEPLSPYLANFCAGHLVQRSLTADRGPNTAIPVALYAAASNIDVIEAVADPELFGPLPFYEQLLGVAYPYEKFDVVFVPNLRSLAFGAPGLLLMRDTVLRAPQEGRSKLYLPLVFAHEIGHAWFGGVVDIREPDDQWLMEALTTYASRTALEQSHPGVDPWSASTSKSLPDHAYAEDAARVKELRALIGDTAIVRGLSTTMNGQGITSKADLVERWSAASGRDLRKWAAERLVPTAEPSAQGDDT